MLRNHLTVALRSLLSHKASSLIALSGLATGMACLLLALLYVQNEYAWDRHHPLADRIYRVIRESRDPGGTVRFTEWTSGPLGPAMRASFPEVQQVMRVNTAYVPIAHGDHSFQLFHAWADSGVLEVLDLPLVRGDRGTVFRKPLSMAITEDMAERVFGDTDPMGKVLTVGYHKWAGDYTVTGVLRNPPASSNFQFHCLTTTVGGPGAELREVAWSNRSGLSRVRTYVVLPEGYDPDRLVAKLPQIIGLMASHTGSEVTLNDKYHLQPLARVHLFSEADYGIRASGDIRQAVLIGLTAFGVLLIACINFVNLTTARSLRRAREVGIRRVAGAHRHQLIRQFLGESMLLAGLASPLALLLARLALPVFSAYVARSLTLTRLLSLPAALSLVGVIALVGVLSGAYPAFFVSALQPVTALRRPRGGLGRSWLRRGLVVLQFAISVVLMIATLVIHSQLTYMSDKDLGYNDDHLVLVPVFNPSRKTSPDPSTRLSARYEVVKRVFEQHPNIVKTTAFRFIPGKGYGGGRPKRVRSEDGRTWRMYVNEVDADFLDVFEIRLVAGRDFSEAIPSDAADAVLINETAREMLGWDDPLGKRLDVLGSSMEGAVVGVVTDFHIQSLREPIEPLVLHRKHTLFHSLGFRIQDDQLPDVIPFVEAQWNQFVPGQAFEYHFADQLLWREYQREREGGSTFPQCSAERRSSLPVWDSGAW